MVNTSCGTAPEDDRPAEDPPIGSAAVCLHDGPYIADGPISVAAAENGDARQVAGLRWQAHEGCERFVIDLALEDGSPASTTGALRAEVLRALGVVRVSLRGVEQVDPDATQVSLDGRLARAAYTVRSKEDRSLHVDLHLAGAAEVSVSRLDQPARVVVDLRPGGEAVPSPAAATGQVVLLEPRAGNASYPLRVAGYARLFEANVVARIVKDGVEVAQLFTTATDWMEAWGQYAMTFDSGPAGPIELHVGDYSANDGSWQGVVVALTMR